MREDVSTKNKQEYSLHLTIQSGEIIRSGVKSHQQISLACDISAMPGVNCTVILNAFEQDLGSIGSISFDGERPTAYAKVNVPRIIFEEIANLLKIAPPRPASLFFVTSRFKYNLYGDISIDSSGKSLTIYDIKWRYPIL